LSKNEFEEKLQVGHGQTGVSVSQTGVSQTGVSQTSVSQTSVSKTSVSKTVVSDSGGGNDLGSRGVVDQIRSREGLRHRGVSTNNSGVSFTLGDGSVGSGVVSLGSSYLGGVFGSSGGNSGEDGGNEGLGVEGGGNSGVDGSNGEGIIVDGKTRILNTESKSIGDVSDGLKYIVGVNIRVSSGDSSISVSDLLLVGVDVGVSVVQVSELILGVELASGGVVRGVGGVGYGGNSVAGVYSSAVVGSSVQGAKVHGLVGGKAYCHKGGKGDKESHDVLPSV